MHPLPATATFPRHFRSCSPPLSPVASCPSLINLRLSAMAPARAVCYASCFCRPVGGGSTPVHSGRAPHSFTLATALTDAFVPWPNPAALCLSGFLAAAATFDAASAARPGPRASARALACALLGVPRAPSQPLADALVAPAASFLGRPPLLPAVSWVADCPSLLGRAPPYSASPSLSDGPYLWLLHFPGTHYHRQQQLLALCVRCPSYSAPANGWTQCCLGPWLSFAGPSPRHFTGRAHSRQDPRCCAIYCSPEARPNGGHQRPQVWANHQTT